MPRATSTTPPAVLQHPKYTSVVSLVLGWSRLPDRQGRSEAFVVIAVAAGAEARTVPLEKILLSDARWLDERHALVNRTLPASRGVFQRGDKPGVYHVNADPQRHVRRCAALDHS